MTKRKRSPYLNQVYAEAVVKREVWSHAQTEVRDSGAFLTPADYRVFVVGDSNVWLQRVVAWVCYT